MKKFVIYDNHIISTETNKGSSSSPYLSEDVNKSYFQAARRHWVTNWLLATPAGQRSAALHNATGSKKVTSGTFWDAKGY